MFRFGNNTSGCGINILIVEDSPTQAVHLRYILEQNSFRVSVARNGKEALAHIHDKKPEIIISDILMPEMDGYQLCERIKTDQSLKDIPVILLTSLSDPTDVIKGLKCGAENFITKPCNMEFLLSRIRYILVNKEIRKSGSAELGIEVFFAGQKHFINSDRIQIIDLLLSTFENALQKQQELEQSYCKLKKAHETIKTLEENYRNLLERNADAMIVVRPDGTVLYVNPAAEILLGRSAGEQLGKRFAFQVAAGEIKEVNVARGEEVLVAEMRVSETNWEGERAYLATLRDVTENVQLREKLRGLSLTDELTGLYNRRGFFTLARQHIKAAGQTKEGLMLIFADVDQMKWINDNLGHRLGDRALIETARILKDTFRESDVIARIGGDEFAVLIPGATGNDAANLSRRLLTRLKALNEQGERPFLLSISLGAAFYDPASPGTIDELLTKADQLMYQQKRRRVPGT